MRTRLEGLFDAIENLGDTKI